MKKYNFKIITAMILFVILMSFVVNICYATDPSKYVNGTITNGTAKTSIKDTMNKRIGFFQIIGTIIAVVMILALGVKYMMGSTEEKAEYKKSFMPYFIGAVLIFAASNIAKIVYNFMSKI